MTLRPPQPAEIDRVFELVQANIAHDGTLHLFQGQPDLLAQHLFVQGHVEAVIAQIGPDQVGPDQAATEAATEASPTAASSTRAAAGHAARNEAGKIVGLALFYTTYSTFLTKPGLFVEDLFVLSDYRSQGIGTQLLAYLAQQVIERGYGRLEWRVRIWNERAIAFYHKLGAQVLPDWRVCQLTGAAMAELAQTSGQSWAAGGE